MFITKKHIPRRTFLRGVGVTVAVPLLDAMVPAHTALARTAARPVPRFAGIWHPHGASPGYWSPLQTGRDFEFSFITEPLERFRDRTVLISGLDCTAAYSTVDEPGGNHARGAVFLSGARPKRDAVTPNLDVTIDQTIRGAVGPGDAAVVHSARHRGPQRQQRQLQLGLQLRIHQLRFLVHPDHAPADRDQSADGVRADVRRTAPARRNAARAGCRPSACSTP